MFKISKKIIISGAIGNALEMYDYVIWGLFSIYLSRAFLPPHSKLSDIFSLFLITFILRPIGALVGGILADQVGRKKVLTWSIVIMGICTTLVGILPSYEKIGIISVFLLLFIRLIQVFSVGSEYISSVALLIESCNKNKKGYFGSWAAFGINAGMLISSLVGTLILYLIDLKLLPIYGWRLAFILAFLTMIFGFWIRNAIPESHEFILANARTEKNKSITLLGNTFQILKNLSLESFLVFSLVLFGVTTTVLLFVYAPIHMITTNSLIPRQSFLINASSLVIVTSLIPLFGHLSDIYGRIRLIFMGTISLLVLIVPYFHCLSYGSFVHIILFHCLMAIPSACIFSITPVFITDIFPFFIRCSATNLLYSIASCLGGGITPLIALKLWESYHCSPGYILHVFGIITLIALLLYIKEDRSVKLTIAI